MTDTRCPAAHHEDPTPCDGPAVVTILDRHNAGANGCEHHGARLLASLEGGRVYPLPDAPDGAAIRVFKAAGTTQPYAWQEGSPRTDATIRAVADELRRYNPSASAEEITAALSRNRNISVTTDYVRHVLRTAPDA